jgi:hypothetical protein
MNTPSRRHVALAPAIALALFGLAGAAWAEEVAVEDVQPVEPPVLDGPPTSRASGPTRTLPNTRDQRQPSVIELQALEDQPITLELPPEFDGLSVVEPPMHGTLLDDHKPMRYIPHPDFNGKDLISFGIGKPVVSFEIKVGAVNDPPRFDSVAGRAHVAGDVGLQQVPRWAKAIEAGPADEAWSQQVWFDASETNDPAGVVESLSVSPDGTLSYVLSGQPGIATWTVHALDNGGNLHGGVSVSEQRLLRIAVDATADLAIKMLPLDLSPSLRLVRSYQIVVSNFGKSDALGARVVDVLPKDAGSPTWRCVGMDGGACPKVEQGFGALDATIDLPGGSTVVFTVDKVASPAGNPGHVAYVVPPDYLIDPNLANNETGE